MTTHYQDLTHAHMYTLSRLPRREDKSILLESPEYYWSPVER